MPTEDATSPKAASKTKSDRYVKLGFLVVTLGIVGWLIVNPYISRSLPGWDEDLQAALETAKAENRKIVLLAYDTPQNHNYGKLRKIVEKPDNREALERANVLRVHLRMDADDLTARKYKITQFPTTLLIGPDDKVITCWVGYIGEAAFRTHFLAGKPQR